MHGEAIVTVLGVDEAYCLIRKERYMNRDRIKKNPIAPSDDLANRPLRFGPETGKLLPIGTDDFLKFVGRTTTMWIKH